MVKCRECGNDPRVFFHEWGIRNNEKFSDLYCMGCYEPKREEDAESVVFLQKGDIRGHYTGDEAHG